MLRSPILRVPKNWGARSEPPGLLERHQVFRGQLLALAELVEDLVRLGLRLGARARLRGAGRALALAARAAQREHDTLDVAQRRDGVDVLAVRPVGLDLV